MELGREIPGMRAGEEGRFSGPGSTTAEPLKEVEGQMLQPVNENPAARGHRTAGMGGWGDGARTCSPPRSIGRASVVRGARVAGADCKSALLLPYRLGTSPPQHKTRPPTKGGRAWCWGAGVTARGAGSGDGWHRSPGGCQHWNPGEKPPLAAPGFQGRLRVPKFFP